ncbi:hypothetical protein INT43_003716 [Umbelopsis isabellina]|uniref:UBX domain-containing protein n=1 Tax=Mortierella isabellina TaxID=91625 RepID=A0A8H7PUW4_MORIS|nr:hypothetical protein INT43_003716 [Umbelopsis isabellina]
MDTLDSLTSEQKDTLEQFQSVTQIDDLDDALIRLTRYNWNLEQAVQSVFDGSAAVESATASREKLEEEVAASTSSETTPLTSHEAGQPSVPYRPHARNNRRWGILSFLAWPFGLAWNITWAMLSFATRYFSRQSITGGNRRTPLSQQRQDPQATAARFLREFEDQFGNTHVEFYAGGYSQALENAKRNLNFLMVVLQSDEHDDTTAFSRDTLTSGELINYLRENNIITWGGNVRETEGYQVSTTLQATTYPFVAIITLQRPGGSLTATPKMTVVDRIEGLNNAATVIRRLGNAKERYGPALERMRREREERDMERSLRDEQDRAYQESLKADQEKERKAQLAREEAARAEEQARLAELEKEQLAQKKEEYRYYLCNQFTEEPDVNHPGGIAKLSFRLPDGSRVIRRFKAEDTIETLYQFVEIYPLLRDGSATSSYTQPPSNYSHKFQFTIMTPYPRTVFQASSLPIKEQSVLWPSATLVVDLLEEDEEVEEA